MVVSNELVNKKELVQNRTTSLKYHSNGPSLIFTGGIHGNEKAGPIALKKVISKIKKDNLTLKGNLYAICGNLNALKKNIRFEDIDLNRIWTPTRIAQLNDINTHQTAESKEQKELIIQIKNILATDKGPFYFIDLHTTSAASRPFITISDSLNNRSFAKNFTLPIILGIEEYLEGPFLTYINEFGHISLGFEAGQHNDLRSVENCEAFIWLCLKATSCLKRKQIKNFKNQNNILSSYGLKQQYFEINYRYILKKNEDFTMLNGFKNFEPIKKGQVLALSNKFEIKASINGQIFMPLYQKQGEDGFFIITPISKYWLGLSSVVRKMRLDQLLRLLPGIKADPLNKYTLIVNPKTAKFLAVKVFHLFGYRKKVLKNKHLYFIKRDRKITSL